MRRPVFASPPSPSCSRRRRPRAQTPPDARYLLPPKAIVDVLDAPPPPDVYLSPARDVVAVLEPRADADHRRAGAADAAPGRPAHRPAQQRPPPRPHRARRSR